MINSSEWAVPVGPAPLAISDEDIYDVLHKRKEMYSLYLEKIPIAAARTSEHIRRKLSILTALYYETI
jgi:hypothetical protein